MTSRRARLRLEEECTRVIERGVEDGVRRSYGCGDYVAGARGLQPVPADEMIQ
jgi:hypothetical protein